jgi:hypothetical protein
LQVLGLDRGRGIANVGESLRDGYSTAGSAGTGLGAVRRLASAFDIYSQPAAGTAVFAEIAPPRRAAASFEIGGVSLPARGETACGDGWAVTADGRRTSVLVVDGLGHGILAAEASREAIRSFQATTAERPRERLEAIHLALKATRGAAVAVAEIDPVQAQVCFAGIGNIAGVIVADGTTRHCVSHNGIAGHDVRRLGAFSYPWPADGVLVMHSDGIMSRWDLSKYPGLARRHPALVAGVLYRDFQRGRDDATVVVARAARR